MAAEPSRPDLLVLGAGPAGCHAAMTAAETGLETVLVDEQPEAGGQVYRAPVPTRIKADKAPDADQTAGDGLREALAASPVLSLFGATIWFAGPGPEIAVIAEGGSRRFRPKALVVAAGAFERNLPVPGWTLPGVIGLAASTILLKSQGVLPGRRTVIAGSGPLLYAAAVKLLERGGTVAAVIDSRTWRDWAGAMPAMAARPDLLRRGVGWMGRLRAAGVPVFRGAAVSEIAGSEAAEGVTVTRLDSAGRPRRDRHPQKITADSVALGHGLIPNTEITRLLGAAHHYDAETRSTVVTRDETLATTLAHVHAVGDGAVIRGAAVAEAEGRLAGLAVARDLGALGRDAFVERAQGLRAELRRSRRFGRAMARLMTPPDGLLETCRADTIVCRCEDVRRAEIDKALDDGAHDLNQLKSWTRCGMGPCQGRMCGDAVWRLMAQRDGPEAGRAGVEVGRTDADSRLAPWSAQVPIRPVPWDAVTGPFTYADIMADLPEPAPWDASVKASGAEAADA